MTPAKLALLLAGYAMCLTAGIMTDEPMQLAGVVLAYLAGIVVSKAHQ